MRLAYIEFNAMNVPVYELIVPQNRPAYYTDKIIGYDSYNVALTFDKIENLTIDENLQVCTSETIRGKNKTFNAFLKPKSITLSGKFSDFQSTKVFVTGKMFNEDTYTYKPSDEDVIPKGENKSSQLNSILTELVDNTRLVTVITFYARYENFVITNFSLTYESNNVINVELTLQEILLKDLNAYQDQGQDTYALLEEISKEEAEQRQEVINRILGR